MGKVKVWKNGGKEDLFVERLISEGSFTKNTKPSSMKEKYPTMFSGFSDNVIRNHLNDLKRKKGLYLHEVGGLSDVEEDDDGHQNEDCPNEASKKDVAVTLSQAITNCSQQNYPVICETYKDPSSLLDMVLVMVNVPGGAQDIKIELNTDGTIVLVKYNWAKSWYNVDELFKNHVAAKEFTMHHPKVLAVKTALEKCRNRIDDAPQGMTTVKLPIKVQTGPDTWKRNGIVREDGMIIVMAEFVGFVKDYHTKNENSVVPLNR